jgi:intein/homing endonuclease
MILGKLWLKPTGKIEIGDEVLTVNPEGEVSITKVKNIARGTSDVIHVIHTDQGHMLKCSPSHPIIMGFGDTTGRPARKVRKGDRVLVTDLSLRQVVEAEVDAIEVLTMEKPMDVVTFELEGKDHTFVADGIVTHNIAYKV